jgi:hypothetical protein
MGGKFFRCWRRNAIETDNHLHLLSLGEHVDHVTFCDLHGGTEERNEIY